MASCPTEVDAVIERMSRAARPTLFDAACDPQLLFALVLSNLMSPSLWSLRDAIARVAATPPEGPGSAGDQRLLMDALERHVNERFFHMLPLDIRDAWGL